MFKVCFFPKHWFHAWGPWQVTKIGQLGRRATLRGMPVPGSDRVIGSFIEQTRQCKTCGLTQVSVCETTGE